MGTATCANDGVSPRRAQASFVQPAARAPEWAVSGPDGQGPPRWCRSVSGIVDWRNRARAAGAVGYASAGLHHPVYPGRGNAVSFGVSKIGEKELCKGGGWFSRLLFPTVCTALPDDGVNSLLHRSPSGRAYLRLRGACPRRSCWLSWGQESYAFRRASPSRRTVVRERQTFS